MSDRLTRQGMRDLDAIGVRPKRRIASRSGCGANGHRWEWVASVQGGIADEYGETLWRCLFCRAEEWR